MGSKHCSEARKANCKNMKGKKVGLYLHPWQGHVTQGLLYFNILMDEGKNFMVNNEENDLF